VEDELPGWAREDASPERHTTLSRRRSSMMIRFSPVGPWPLRFVKIVAELALKETYVRLAFCCLTKLQAVKPATFARRDCHADPVKVPLLIAHLSVKASQPLQKQLCLPDGTGGRLHLGVFQLLFSLRKNFLALSSYFKFSPD